jgi:hypothetical protein
MRPHKGRTSAKERKNVSVDRKHAVPMQERHNPPIGRLVMLNPQQRVCYL